MTLATRIEEVVPGVVVSASSIDRIAYARDLWPRHHLAVSAGRIAEHRPDVVVWPRSVEEVAAIVRLCASEGVPVVPYGAGSGVCGGVLPDNRTVVLDLKRIADIRSINKETQVLDVGAARSEFASKKNSRLRVLPWGIFHHRSCAPPSAAGSLLVVPGNARAFMAKSKTWSCRSNVSSEMATSFDFADGQTVPI